MLVVCVNGPPSVLYVQNQRALKSAAILQSRINAYLSMSVACWRGTLFIAYFGVSRYIVCTFSNVHHLSVSFCRYLEHIAKESTCKVELHGRGSGHIDPQTNQEAPESMHIYLEHADKNSLAKGKELCINLVTTVRLVVNCLQRAYMFWVLLAAFVIFSVVNASMKNTCSYIHFSVF